MKTKHELHAPSAFRPVTISFTIDKPDELRELWHTLNVPVNIVRDIAKKAGSTERVSLPARSTTAAYDLWQEVDTVAIALGVKEVK